jgi:hypothetical protein
MSKTTKVVGELELRAIALPAKTATYTVISHGFIIDEVRTELAKAGYTIAEEEYRASNNLEIATGSYIINKESDPTFAMSFSWVNSYDKSTRFQCAIGGYVWENNGYVIDKEDNASIRKHTGDANAIVQETIKEKVSNADKFYSSVHADKEQMMEITLSRSEVAKVLGELFFSYDMLSIEQLSGIKKEYIKPSFMYSTDADHLWTIYCHMLTVIKTSHPKTWMQQQAFIHNYLKMNYLGKAPVKGFVPVEFSEPVVSKDPAQIDLLEQIAIIEQMESETKEQFFSINDEIPAEEPAQDASTLWSAVKISSLPTFITAKSPIPVDTDMVIHTEELTKEEVLEQYQDMFSEEQLASIDSAGTEILDLPKDVEIVEATDDTFEYEVETIHYTDPAGNTFETEQEVLPTAIADKITDDNIIKLIQEEVNNIFSDETEITVYLNGDNYDAVTADDQIISVPVAYINNLI